MILAKINLFGGIVLTVFIYCFPEHVYSFGLASWMSGICIGSGMVLLRDELEKI